METFLGYTYVKINSATNAPGFTAVGGSGQFTYTFNEWLGGVADLGAVHSGKFNGVPLDNTMINFLFGPRISLHYSRVRPYFQILWGGVYQTASTQIDAVLPPTAVPPIYLPGEPVTARLTSNQTAFGMTVGGGLDLKLTKHIDLRPVGVDYYLTRLQNLRAQGDNSQNNFRYTTGFNFTFGAQ